MSNKLRKGQILQIYTNFKDEEGYQGKVILREYRSEGETFYAKKDDKVEEDILRPIYSYEKWTVEFVESNQFPKGFRTIRGIRKLIVPEMKRTKVNTKIYYRALRQEEKEQPLYEDFNDETMIF